MISHLFFSFVPLPHLLFHHLVKAPVDSQCQPLMATPSSHQQPLVAVVAQQQLLPFQGAPLRKEAPISQQPAPVYQSQPVASSFQGRVTDHFSREARCTFLVCYIYTFFRRRSSSWRLTLATRSRSRRSTGHETIGFGQ